MQIKPNTKNKFEYFTCVNTWLNGNQSIFLLKGDKVKLIDIDGNIYIVEVIDGFNNGMELTMSIHQFVNHLEYTFIQKCK